MLVPVGIAYAEASGVPGIYGLYATIVPLLAYALFGPSRILVLGPDSSLAAVILAVVAAAVRRAIPQRAVALAGMMAIVSGVVCIAAGLARLGFVTELLSKPIRYGYMNGIALTVLISQMPKLLGFSIDGDGPLRQASGDRRAASLAGSTNLDGARDRRRHARADPAAQALAARARHPDRGRRRDAWSSPCSISATRAGVSVLGPLPQGLPTLALPLIALRRSRAGAHRRPRGRAGVVRRHERAVAHLCGAPAHAGRSEPGDGRARRGQSRGRVLPGLSDQQQLVAHAGRRSRRREDAADRRRRRGRRSRCCCSSRRTCCRICRNTALAAVVIAVGDRPVRDRRPARASIASSGGSSGCRWSASPASRCSARFRASGSRS